MAGSAPVEEAPKLGKVATIFGFVFVLLILTGFSAATMSSYRDQVKEINSYHADEYGDDHGDEYADDHSDEYDEDATADDHGDEDAG